MGLSACAMIGLILSQKDGIPWKPSSGQYTKLMTIITTKAAKKQGIPMRRKSRGSRKPLAYTMALGGVPMMSR